MRQSRTVLITIAAVLVLAGIAAIFYFLTSGTPPAASVPAPIELFDASLQTRADKLATLFGELASVPVYLTESADGETDDLVRGVAYTRCVVREPTIVIKEEFYRRANETQLINILKHELTHAFFCRDGVKAGHDARFREKFASVGGVGN